jgi:hypothetical protein
MTREILGDGEPSAEAAPPKLLPGAIDWTKPVRTKGRKVPVTIYAVDPALKKPVVGRVNDDHDLLDWGLDGSFHAGRGESGLDLENVPAAPAPALGAPLDELIKAAKCLLRIWDTTRNRQEVSNAVTHLRAVVAEVEGK